MKWMRKQRSYSHSLTLHPETICQVEREAADKWATKPVFRRRDFTQGWSALAVVYSVIFLPHSVLLVGQKDWIWSHLRSLVQTGAFPSHHSFKARFMECMTKICSVQRELWLSAAPPYHATMDLLAATLTNAPLAWPVSLGTISCLGRFPVVP